MFKSARWKSEKNKMKVVFKLQFHAAQLTQLEADSLMISIVPADVGKPTAKSDKVAVRNGSCLWENPVYENVKFNRDPKSGKILERIYYFVVGTGSSKAGVIGEASIDFSSYAEATKISLVSLPLKNSKTEAVLHVSIQRIHDSIEQREVEEIENVKGIFKDHSLKSQLEESDMDQIIRSSSIEDLPLNKTDSHIAELKRNSLVSSGSDVTLLSSEGVEIPWLNSEEGSDIVIEKLKTEIFSLSRQAEMSELELQTLRKQIVKESKRGNDFFKEVVSLKEEREKLKTNSHFEGGDSKAIIEELRQELNNAKELNFNLQIQLQKMQESNSELILAVRDLEEMLENKNRETQEVGPTYQTDDEVEQNALDELVKERSDSKEAYLLEQQIVDLHSEIEIFKRDKDELEIQMEQLALDYEIIKQENHDMLYKLEQSQIQEQLKIQYECSPFYNERELESHIENLEAELKKRTKESEDSLIRITKLETHIKDLEKELEQQEEGFEADLEALTCSKVEQEKRAIRAEESLRKTRWQNANMAERIQEEFRRISLQMTSTFEANERYADKALEEAKKLQFEKKQLEEMLQKLSDEILILKDEIELYSAKNKILMEQMEDKETLKGVLEKTRLSIKEMELLVEQGNDERIELENNFMFVKNEAEELHMELNKLRCLLEEKESIVGNLQGEFKLKETALEMSSNAFLEKEIYLRHRIEELEGKLEVLNQSSAHCIEDEIKQVAPMVEDQAPNCRFCEDMRNINRESLNTRDVISNENGSASISTTSNCKSLSEVQNDSSTSNSGDIDELRNEMGLIKEMNKSTEEELKQMQEKYSEISLKFAEVENERQQLAMKVRYLKKAKKRAHNIPETG